MVNVDTLTTLGTQDSGRRQKKYKHIKLKWWATLSTMLHISNIELIAYTFIVTFQI